MKMIAVWIMLVTSLYAISVQEKVRYLDNIKTLIILTETMRGNTNVYTKGETMDIKVVEKDRAAVSKALKKLHKVFEQANLSQDRSFQEIDKYIQNLNEVASELDSMVTFKANSLLIKEMLRIGGAAQVKFFSQPDTLNYKASQVMMFQILPMTEYLGQLRGLSAGEVACHGCSDDESLEYIKDYLAEANDALYELTTQMKVLKKHYPRHYEVLSYDEVLVYEREVKHYLDHIEAVVINKQPVADQDCDFFVQGTKMISQTLRYYDINKAAIE